MVQFFYGFRQILKKGEYISPVHSRAWPEKGRTINAKMIYRFYRGSLE